MGFKRIKRTVKTAAILAACLALTAAGGGPSALVVLSSKASPYVEHAQGFKSRFPGKTRVIALSELEKERSGREEKPDIVVAVGSRAAEESVRLYDDTPVLFTMVYNPSAHGLAGNQNVSGLSLMVPPSETLKALYSLVPSEIKKLKFGAVRSKGRAEADIETLKSALDGSGHTLEVAVVENSSESGRAFRKLSEEVDVIWLVADPVAIPDQGFLVSILELALKKKVAVVGLSSAHVKLGALVSVSVDYYLEGVEAAKTAAELTGEDPPKPEIKGPQSLIWSVNDKVASEIGWPLPPAIKNRFERVYP